MNRIMGIVYFVLLFFAFSAHSKELPDILSKRKCTLNDANFKKCYIESANEAIPEITKGYPELGLPSLYPYKEDFRRLINLRIIQLNISDISFYGLQEMKMTDMDLDMDKGILKETLSHQNVTVAADYNMDGKILLLQVSGNGKVQGYFKNPTYHMTNTFKIVKKDGEDYMERVSTHADIVIEKATFNFENLFNGNKELADIAIKAINDNWQSFLRDYGRFIEEFLEEVYGVFFDKIFGSFPIKDIFKQ